jgi:hypothetical protein
VKLTAHKASSGQGHTHTDLEINEDLEYQRRAWRFQRIGWIVIALVLVGGLLGLFGRGPLSRSVATDRGNRLAVEYDRIARYDSPFRLVIQFHPSPQSSQTASPESSQTVRLWIDRQYAKSLKIEEITPEADRAELTGDGVVYIFRVTPSQPSTVTLTGTMQGLGWVEGRLGADPSDAVIFRQFVLP